MGSPFRSDEEVLRERAEELEAELHEIDKKLFAARATERGLSRRAHPFVYTLFSFGAFAWLALGVAFGVALHFYGLHGIKELVAPTQYAPPSTTAPPGPF